VAADDIPEEVKRFMTDNIISLFQLETLLLLYTRREMEWSVEDTDRELHIGPQLAKTQLVDLHSRGLLSASETPDTLYRYNPSSDQLDQAVSALATAYKERRVSVISFIFSKPFDKVRIFADAFRFRRDK
jgi:hypothetical protein